MTLASKCCPRRAWLVAALMVTFGGSACAQSAARSEFEICKGQTYALCAAARCTVFDGVAYCQCDVKSGDGISLPFQSSTLAKNPSDGRFCATKSRMCGL